MMKLKLSKENQRFGKLASTFGSLEAYTNKDFSNEINDINKYILMLYNEVYQTFGRSEEVASHSFQMTR